MPPDQEPELDRAALQIARIQHPDLNIDFWIAELDRHAFAVAERAGDLTDGKHFVESINAYLFEELDLAGNEEDFYHPDNSCINRVFETKRGIPITLSVIYMEIARRLAKPVYGVNAPAHFIIRYDDGHYAALIDPFNKGALIEMQDMVEPASNPAIIQRMLRNLRQIYFTNHDSEKALQVLDLLIANEPDAIEEHKQRGAVLTHLNRMQEAREAFHRYLELSPDAPDRDEVKQQIRNLAHWQASRN